MKGKYLILEKLEDKKFNGNHPNFINVGSKEIQGYCVVEPIIDEQFILYSLNTDEPKLGNHRTAWTSRVKSFDSDAMILETENSTYKINIR